jgi:hypothetical protein
MKVPRPPSRGLRRNRRWNGFAPGGKEIRDMTASPLLVIKFPFPLAVVNPLASAKRQIQPLYTNKPILPAAWRKEFRFRAFFSGWRSHFVNFFSLPPSEYEKSFKICRSAKFSGRDWVENLPF